MTVETLLLVTLHHFMTLISDAPGIQTLATANHRQKAETPVSRYEGDMNEQCQP